MALLPEVLLYYPAYTNLSKYTGAINGVQGRETLQLQPTVSENLQQTLLICG
ncbi:MAG: hypothetical protein JSV68_00735 [Anaerolineaceae bacterium]|nr:MAG: hypothetical protein JSV68_00735 [Anaerolineaceae bacterium]